MTHRESDSSLSRRQLLRNGGIVLSMGAVIAACGSNRSGVTAPGRVGFEDAPEEPNRDLTVDDVVLLRTAQSLEHVAVEAHTMLLEMGLFGEAAAVAERFVADHVAHSEAIGELITAAGGEPYACANPFVMGRAVEPVVAAIESSDDPERDAFAAAHALETWLGASHQALVSQLSDPALRSAVAGVCGDEHRHAATLALAVNDDPIGPELGGDGEAVDAEGFPVPYAIPATFGQLGGVELVVGDIDDETVSRTSVTLQTPAQNTFVYNDLSC